MKMPTNPNDNPGELASEVRVAVGRLGRRLRKQSNTTELPPGLFSVLVTLYKNGAITVGSLAEHENTRPPSMTRAVNSLAELGLVQKLPDDHDRRLILVALTDTGREEVIETRRRKDAWLDKQLQNLTAQEREILTQASEILLRIACK